jgi:hypothetical protein
MMDMNMAQGDAEMPGMEMQPENKVTIEKLPDGTYSVEQAGHGESLGEDETGEAGQSYQTAMEACQAAIAMLDGGGDADADAEIMDGYNGPRGQMKKVGVKEVFGG